MSSAIQQSFTFTPRANEELRRPWLMDPILVLTTIGLVLFSIVMIYSTTAITGQERYGDALFFVKRQTIAAIVGIALMFVAARVPIELTRRASPILLIIVYHLLLLTFIPGLGDAAGGAQRWLKIGPLRFQPGEAVKLFFIIFAAGFWSRHEDRVEDFTYGILKPMLLAGSVGGLLLMQPDFGSASIVILVTLSMALAAGARIRYLALGFMVAAIGAAILIMISPYRMARVMSFLSPFHDASGKGYQLIQSLIAVGTGQITGTGLGGSQQKLFFLPAAHTDFLFAVVAEELGFIGCLAVLAAFVLFLFRGLKIADGVAEDTYKYSLAVGLTLLVVLPAFLNVGVVIGLLPTKGLVLPLVGYGGSSLIASLVGVGLLLGIGRSLYTPGHRAGS